MKIFELLVGLHSQLDDVPLKMNPFYDRWTLQEAQIIDIRHDVLSGAVGVIFELRQALQLDEANTGVLVCRGVTDLKWNGVLREGLTAWSVIGLDVQFRGEILNLQFGIFPDADLVLIARSAEFYVVDVPSIGNIPSDYTETDRIGVSRAVADWNSKCKLVAVARSGFDNGRPSPDVS